MTNFSELCQAAVENCPDGIIALSRDCVLQTNARAAKLVGYSLGEIIGMPVKKLLRPHPSLDKHERPISRIIEDCATSGTNHLVLPITELPQSGALEMRVWPIPPLKDAAASDQEIVFIRLSTVSGQISQDYSMRHVQKLEALGGLMGGVAHEINTPSQFVGDSLSYLQDAFDLLLSQISETDHSNTGQGTRFAELQNDVKQALEQALEGMDRIRDIASAVKEFSRKDGTDAVGTDLNHLIEMAVIVTRNSYKYVADISLDLQDWPPMTPCFPGEIHQVLLNLIVNAAHAIEDAQSQQNEFRRGQILIRSQYSDETATIEVFDTGTGITDAVRSSAFTPYFTTKGAGRGTGQGLSLCRQIALAHGGDIEIANHNSETLGNSGAVVRVTLPLDIPQSSPNL